MVGALGESPDKMILVGALGESPIPRKAHLCIRPNPAHCDPLDVVSIATERR
jgi:hypothetical protein